MKNFNLHLHVKHVACVVTTFEFTTQNSTVWVFGNFGSVEISVKRVLEKVLVLRFMRY